MRNRGEVPRSPASVEDRVFTLSGPSKKDACALIAAALALGLYIYLVTQSQSSGVDNAPETPSWTIKQHADAEYDAMVTRGLVQTTVH